MRQPSSLFTASAGTKARAFRDMLARSRAGFSASLNSDVVKDIEKAYDDYRRKHPGNELTFLPPGAKKRFNARREAGAKANETVLLREGLPGKHSSRLTSVFQNCILTIH